MDFTPLTSCRACGSSQLELMLDLGRQPLANNYVKEPVAQPTFPLELMVCPKCWLSQLSVVVNPDLMFRDYLYVSGTSLTLRNHFAAFARDTLAWFTPRPARVLDLACNDGTLLDAFRQEGCEVWGVDPAHNLVALARSKGLNVVDGYWPQARQEVPGQFDLITAANVLAHVADPRAFLQAALDSLTPDGAVVVEFPYCRNMILHGEWDTIYHEHLSYFLVRPLLTLAERLGAKITRALPVPVHGGSLRLAFQRSEAGYCPELLALVAAEEREGLTERETYVSFARHVDRVCLELKALVSSSNNNGRRVIGFGASAKGNTLLNRAALDFDYIVDDNPLKHGYLTPGRHIPIRPPTELSTEPKDLAVVLLAWNFAAEIVRKIRQARPHRDDEIIHYVPRAHRHPISQPLPSSTPTG